MPGFIATHIDQKKKRKKTLETVLTLFNAILRPQLEYTVQFWFPNYNKDEAKLERVQRGATKLIPALKILPNEQRLKKFRYLFS